MSQATRDSVWLLVDCCELPCALHKTRFTCSLATDHRHFVGCAGAGAETWDHLQHVEWACVTCSATIGACASSLCQP